MDRESERGGVAVVVVVDEGRGVIERRGDLLRHRRGGGGGGCEGMRQGGLRVCKDGAHSYRGQGKGCCHAYIYQGMRTVSRDAPSVVSTTKLPLVKLEASGR